MSADADRLAADHFSPSLRLVYAESPANGSIASWSRPASEAHRPVPTTRARSRGAEARPQTSGKRRWLLLLGIPEWFDRLDR